MKIKFVAGFSPISKNVADSAVFYADALGIHFEGDSDDYRYTQQLEGVKHFSVWPLRDAAMACFGVEHWPKEFAEPNSSIEFEVEDVAEAEQELIREGYQMIHSTRVEPWGQTTARLLSPEGVLIGIVSTPWLNEQE
ncbi:MAG: VOC family protein [Microbacteriaceae bacterium]